MPIPSVKVGESQDQYVSRCVSEIYDEYGQTQGTAICIQQYNQNMSMTTAQKVNKKIARIGQLRGINLYADGSYNLEEPCWENYIQIGMKEKDGKMVPNCVLKD